MVSKKSFKVLVKTKNGGLVGVVPVGTGKKKKFSFVFKKKGKLVLGKGRFKNRETIAKKALMMINKRKK